MRWPRANAWWRTEYRWDVKPLPFFALCLASCLATSGFGQSGSGARDDAHAQDMVAIHALLSDSTKVKRTTKHVPGGVSTVTESNDSKVTRLIQQHTAAMQKRLTEGRPIRDWDPLFAALFERHDKIKLVVTNTKKGVAVTETSDDPEVVALIRAHAAAVDGFVKRGTAGIAHDAPRSGRHGADRREVPW